MKKPLQSTLAKTLALVRQELMREGYVASFGGRGLGEEYSTFALSPLPHRRLHTTTTICCDTDNLFVNILTEDSEA